MNGSIFSVDPVPIDFGGSWVAPSDLFQERLTQECIAKYQRSKISKNKASIRWLITKSSDLTINE